MDETAVERLKWIKSRRWFYEFDLPDGTKTQHDLSPHVFPIHQSRLEKLLWVIREKVPDAGSLSAFDLASHEGFYSIALSKHFSRVRGYEFRDSSISSARIITEAVGATNVEYVQADLQTMAFDPAQTADFVLLFGLLYHLENPIHTLRLASQMSRKHILIETQVYPYDISGPIEDGAYYNVRPVQGVFALSPDYASSREGGSTEVALIPSLNALVSLMKNFGFSEVMVLPSPEGDYEQFRRGSRVVVYGRKK
ncbi:MAG TPA: methyltransferase domain-containing protein [Roseomonas sp.]|nr:methyltransferase domain-containing protein [Roseomonas sp.]